MRRASTTPLVAALAAGVLACGPSEEDLATSRAAAIEVVEGFGSRLVHVSLLAPPDTLADQVRDTYGPYVTTLLLGGWLSDLSSAPGRSTSSPWPARVDVRSAEPVGSSAFDVTGDVVYVTSVDGDPVLREPVRARVVRGPDDIWRIAEWNEP